MGIGRFIPNSGILGTVKRALASFFRASRSRIFRKFGPNVSKTAYDVLMRSNWGDETFELCFYGGYGYSLSRILSERREKFVFIDIGANQGLSTLIAAKNPACSAAYAFEPVL